MHSEYTFFHDECPDEDEDGANDVPTEGKNDPIIEKQMKLPCGHTYFDHVWYDKP